MTKLSRNGRIDFKWLDTVENQSKKRMKDVMMVLWSEKAARKGESKRSFLEFLRKQN